MSDSDWSERCGDIGKISVDGLSNSWRRMPGVSRDGIWLRFSIDKVTESVVVGGEVRETRDVTADYERTDTDDGNIQWVKLNKLEPRAYRGFGMKAGDFKPDGHIPWAIEP